MIRSARGVVVGFAALVAALAICAALPAIDPRCGTVSDGAAMLGTCGVARSVFPRDLLMTGLLTALAMLGLVAGLVARQAVAHHRLSEGLRRHARPAVIADLPIGLVPGVGAALVAGIRHPRIYCSDDVLTSLEAEELAAVLLHERHHELNHAPAKLVLLAALAPLICRAGAGSAWLERQRARIEIAADEHALENGATRRTLARAILKLSDASPTLTLAAFASASELRMRALLGGGPVVTGSSARFVPFAISAGAVVALVCSAMSLL